LIGFRGSQTRIWERFGSVGRPTDAPPLTEQFEAFGKQSGWNRAIQLKLTQTPAARFQMRNVAGDRMIQVQNCRLDYNWIGLPGQQYPRYRTVRPEFDQVLGEFEKLIADDHLGELVPNQWEVTYVNHMLKGTVWDDPEDWASVLGSLLGPVVVPDGLRFEGFGGHWHFEIEPGRGRLHVELQHAFVGGPEQEEALAMKLTARGPTGKDKEAKAEIDAGLNLGHDVIVTSFEKLTSRDAHDWWNREIGHG
jgi:uncharacterized protein (TIGR04255 family)